MAGVVTNRRQAGWIKAFTRGGFRAVGEAAANALVMKLLDMTVAAVEDASLAIKEAYDDKELAYYHIILREAMKKVRDQRESQEGDFFHATSTSTSTDAEMTEAGEGKSETYGGLLPTTAHNALRDSIVSVLSQSLQASASQYLPEFLAMDSALPPQVALMLGLAWVGYQGVSDSVHAEDIAHHVLSMMHAHWREMAERAKTNGAIASTMQASLIDRLPFVTEEDVKLVQSGTLQTVSFGVGRTHVVDPIQSNFHNPNSEQQQRLRRAQNIIESGQASEADVIKALLQKRRPDDPFVTELVDKLILGRSGQTMHSMRHIDWEDVWVSFAVTSLSYGDPAGYADFEWFTHGYETSTHEFRDEELVMTVAVVDDPEQTTVVFGIKGTSGVKDVGTDLSANLTEPIETYGYDKEEIGFVHEGFYQAALRLEPYVMKALNKLGDFDRDTRVIFTGHSMGGAIAMCLATLERVVRAVESAGWDLGDNDDNPIQVQIYGAPRCVDSTMAHHLETLHFLAIQRFANSSDPVPFLPPKFMGYAHAGIEFRIGNHGYYKVVRGDGSRNTSQGQERTYSMLSTQVTKGHGREMYGSTLQAMRKVWVASHGGGPLEAGGINPTKIMNFGSQHNTLQHGPSKSTLRTLESELRDVVGASVNGFNSQGEGALSYEDYLQHLVSLNPESTRTIVDGVSSVIQRNPSVASMMARMGPRAGGSVIASTLTSAITKASQ